MSPATDQHRLRRVRAFWAATLLVLCGAIAYGLWPRPLEVDTATIDRGTVTVEASDEGRSRMHEVYVLSAPVAGLVLRVDVEPGDRVRRGDVIARIQRAAAGFLDPRSDLQAGAGVSVAQANLRAAESALELAAREAQRLERLSVTGAVSVAELDAAKSMRVAARAARDAATAELARARAGVAPAERTLPGEVTVRAPAPGVVLGVPQKSEAVVPVGAPLVVVGDPARVEVVAEFLSQEAVRIPAGAPARIENWGGAAMAARVDRVEPVARTKVSALGIEEQRTNVILKLESPAQAAALGHDFRVDVRVVLAETPAALRVPLGALFRVDEGWAVFQVRDGRARLTPVAAAAADERFRIVTAGLQVGDQVVLFPPASVTDGARVVARR